MHELNTFWMLAFLLVNKMIIWSRSWSGVMLGEKSRMLHYLERHNRDCSF